MSILNVWIEPERGMVAVDTFIRHSNSAELIHGAKMLPLPHAKMVLAHRGEGVIGLAVWMELLTAPVSLSVDELAPYLVDLGNRAFDLRKAEQGHLYGEYPLECELVLVGWSDAHKRIVGYHLTRSPNDSTFTVRVIDRWAAGPQVWDSWKDVPPFPTAKAVVPIAQRQVAEMRKKFGGIPIGGRLLVAEVTRYEVNIRTQCGLA